MGVMTPVADATVGEGVQRVEAWAVVREGLQAGARPDLQAEHRRDEEAEHDHGRRGGDEAVPDDEACPCRPAARGGAFLADAGVVDARPDAGEQRGQQGEHDGHADQRDQHPGEAHAAQGRHGQDQQRQQADRDGDARGHDGVSGCLHRDHDGLLVAAAVGAFLPPSRDQDQRVVDGDAEPDQRDEELDDDADVGERR